MGYRDRCSEGNFYIKVEKVLKGSLDSIPLPSPSVKFQIMGGNVCLMCKGKTLCILYRNVVMRQKNPAF